MLDRRLDLWLPTYLLSTPRRVYGWFHQRRKLTHIVFLVCDHFEPRFWIKREEQPAERLRAWHSGFAKLQKHCLEKYGTKPTHTWFYPPHHGSEHLQNLAEMVFDGLGEVELHYHHDGDTSETLRRDLTNTLVNYNAWGHLLESGSNPKRAFGFIHGDWALANSCGGKFCGVNDELAILEQLGCWGDFTMPSADACQTRKINAIYYATGNPRQPKSHNWGKNAQVGIRDARGMLLMQGPLGINWRAPRFPRIENASLTSANWGRPDRIRKWLDCHVHVRGRPEWLFIKLHTHGAWEEDFDALFGEKAMEMHRILNEQYNDGENFALHYVTARQAYNIAKAAEHGKAGSPADWVDFLIKPPPHIFYTLDSPHELVNCTKDQLEIKSIEIGKKKTLRTKICPIKSATGYITALKISAQELSAAFVLSDGEGDLRICIDNEFQLASIEGGVLIAMQNKSSHCELHISCGRKCVVRCRPSRPIKRDSPL